MPVQGTVTLKSFFAQRRRPTSAQFADLIDSAAAKVSAVTSANAIAGPLVQALTTASAQLAIGGGAAGRPVFEAGTTASARNNLGIGAVGTIQIDQGTTASAQTVIGGGAAGRTAFEAITTASARQALDVAVATTAQMSAPTNTSSAFVTPGLQHYHPLHPKAEVEFNLANAAASAFQSWNVASMAKLATGQARITWGSAFANKNYGVLTGNIMPASDSRTNAVVESSAGAKAAGDCQIRMTNNAGAAIDSSAVSILVFDR